MVIVGGLGSLHGALFGAIFVALLPPLIASLRDSMPGSARPTPRPSSASALIGAVGDGRRRLRQEARASRPASSA